MSPERAALHYETRGAGPLLILIPGASGTGDTFSPLAAALAEQVSLVTYDRRGFSHSTLHGPQPLRRLDADADDVCSLIDHLSGQPTAIYGASSGAIVALHTLTRHPERIATALAFEPPVVTVLPDAYHWRDTFTSIYHLYRQAAPTPSASTSPPSSRCSSRCLSRSSRPAAGSPRGSTDTPKSPSG